MPQEQQPRPGDLVEAPQYVFAFRLLEPAPPRPRRLLVLLHGAFAPETQLADIGVGVDQDTLVVMPRAQVSVGEDAVAWYRVAFHDDAPEAVGDEAEQARARLLAFLGQLQQRHDVPPARTVLAGFSQGGVLAASVALTAPASVAGIAMLAGRVLPGLRVAAGPALRGIDALLVHGREDRTLPVAHAREARKVLAAAGLRVCLRLHPGKHAPTAAMLREVVAWYTDGARRWQQAAVPAGTPPDA